MLFQAYFKRSLVANYVRAIRSTPREVICNRHVLLSAAMYAMCGIPQTWDQGSSATVPSLKGFQHQFGLSSGANSEQIKTFVSIIYVGYAIGAAGSFLLNNKLGRLWSYRLYALIYIVGQLIAVFAPSLSVLYVARVISGIGIGSITVIGPMALVEISPSEIRGLLTSWYVVALGIALTTASFTSLGVYNNIPASRLQYQLVWAAPTIWMTLCIFASFFLCESPRWLIMAGRHHEGVQTLSRLRGLPIDHPRVRSEMNEIDADIAKTSDVSGFFGVAKETLTVPSNLRRLQQVLVAYALAQLSGANTITTYFVSVMSIIDPSNKSPTHSLFLSGMYGFSKLCFSIIAAFFFIDALGRRASLLIGTAVQALSHVYIGIYVKKTQQGSVPESASQAAVAALFIHAAGYAVGLLVLPYVFGSELWPNKIRSFGTALTATLHWLFYYAMKYAFPSLLQATHDWGAFIFFAAWCMIAWVYVFFFVPEVAALSVEEIEQMFRGPWFKAYKKRPVRLIDAERDLDDDSLVVHSTKDSPKIDSQHVN